MAETIRLTAAANSGGTAREGSVTLTNTDGMTAGIAATQARPSSEYVWASTYPSAFAWGNTVRFTLNLSGAVVLLDFAAVPAWYSSGNASTFAGMRQIMMDGLATITADTQGVTNPYGGQDDHGYATTVYTTAPSSAGNVPEGDMAGLRVTAYGSDGKVLDTVDITWPITD